MATTKKRLNVTLSPEAELLVSQLATRDQVPVATKARELLELSLELVEDQVLMTLAEERVQSGKNKQYLSHQEVWGV